MNSDKFLAVAFWAVESVAEFPALNVLNSWYLLLIVTVCVQFSTDATCTGVFDFSAPVLLSDSYLPSVIVFVVLFLFFIVPTGTHTNWFLSVPFSITIPSCTAGICSPVSSEFV